MPRKTFLEVQRLNTELTQIQRATWLVVPAQITFSELTPLKSPVCIPGCYGNGRLHQNNNMVRTTSPRRLRKLERKRQRAPETPRTHNGPPNRINPTRQVIFEFEIELFARRPVDYYGESERA